MAGRKLYHEGHWRSSASRLYYAAYAALTADLAGRVDFPRGRNNPPHEALWAYIDRNLRTLRRNDRARLKTLVRRLYDMRTDADYFPQRSIGRDEARRCLSDAWYVLKYMKVQHD